ncbi:Uncharacterised protein [Legionella beliardensis]|uniref:Transmembrane protein n=1 Tax=Legionella beliardensis TaxID=91822 RepID=A0A378I039_9GAMM|nr:hypothetical protein [Legionella beliardensis]STX28342.1 Uncharacterised protein [Legionella beliardensis]
MNEHTTVVDPVSSPVAGPIDETYPSWKRISWSAVFVGALVGVGLGFLLNLFGIAIGLTAFTINSDTGATAVAIGGLIGMLIGIIASMVAAGYTAGYLGRHYCPKRNIGVIYGFTTWTLALLLSAIVTAHIGNYVASYTNNMARTGTVLSKNNTMATAANSLTATSTQAGNGGQNTVAASPESLAVSAFIVFVLFFIGALASCFGAVWGMNCKRVD